MPYTSQVRENFRNKKVKKKTFGPSICRLFLTSFSGEKSPIHSHCFCKQEGRKGWLERQPGGATRHTHSGMFKPAEALGVDLSLQ